jgi:hypothetical protein
MADPQHRIHPPPEYLKYRRKSAPFFSKTGKVSQTGIVCQVIPNEILLTLLREDYVLLRHRSVERFVTN